MRSVFAAQVLLIGKHQRSFRKPNMSELRLMGAPWDETVRYVRIADRVSTIGMGFNTRQCLSL